MRTKEETFITTYTGKRFYPFNPRPEDVDIVDIAHALSQKVRWNGHTRRPYTVGAHSIAAAMRIQQYTKDRNQVLGALLHDASESYFADVPTPIKIQLPDVIDMEESIQRVVEKHFDLPELTFDSDLVKRVDKECLWHEARSLINKPSSHLLQEMPPDCININSIYSPDYDKPIEAGLIAKAFLDMYYSNA